MTPLLIGHHARPRLIGPLCTWQERTGFVSAVRRWAERSIKPCWTASSTVSITPRVRRARIISPRTRSPTSRPPDCGRAWSSSPIGPLAPPSCGTSCSDPSASGVGRLRRASPRTAGRPRTPHQPIRMKALTRQSRHSSDGRGRTWARRSLNPGIEPWLHSVTRGWTCRPQTSPGLPFSTVRSRTAGRRRGRGDCLRTVQVGGSRRAPGGLRRRSAAHSPARGHPQRRCHRIPERSDQVRNRARRGSRGGLQAAPLSDAGAASPRRSKRITAASMFTH